MGYFEYDKMTQHAVDYQHFLLNSPSTFHAASLVRQCPEDTGFTPQNEKDLRNASPGGHVVLRSSAAVAWVIPETLTEDASFRVAGTHTDSPAFRVEPSTSLTSPDGFEQIDIEVYSGMLWNSRPSRELAIVGRLLIRDSSQVLVRTGALARIPQLTVHLDRIVNPEGLRLDPQQHLRSIWFLDSDADLTGEVVKYTGVKAEDIMSHDLVLVSQQGPGTLGDRGQFFIAGQQGNLSSIHSGSTALEHLAAKGMPREGGVLVFITFNHEEVGPETRSGAVNPFFANVLERTGVALGRDLDARHYILAQSSCVSTDAVHSAHPSYIERHDPYSRPAMDRGPIVRINVDQRYVTDAEGTASQSRVCEATGATSQSFVSHNAIPCGSTIGPITAIGLGTLTVDMGVGLLSVHSAREVSHVDGLIALSKALEAY